VKEDDSLWFLGDGRTDQGFESNLLATEPLLIYNCTNLPDSNKNNLDFLLYPNPTSDILFWSKNIQIRKVTVYSVNGDAVLFQNVSNNSIDVTSLAYGTYLIKLESGSKIVYHSKFVKK